LLKSTPGKQEDRYDISYWLLVSFIYLRITLSPWRGISPSVRTASSGGFRLVWTVVYIHEYCYIPGKHNHKIAYCKQEGIFCLNQEEETILVLGQGACSLAGGVTAGQTTGFAPSPAKVETALCTIPEHMFCGIQAIGAVVSVSKVFSFSVPKEGLLSHGSEDVPGFMALLAKGIKDGERWCLFP